MQSSNNSVLKFLILFWFPVVWGYFFYSDSVKEKEKPKLIEYFFELENSNLSQLKSQQGWVVVADGKLNPAYFSCFLDAGKGNALNKRKRELTYNLGGEFVMDISTEIIDNKELVRRFALLKTYDDGYKPMGMYLLDCDILVSQLIVK